jgi:hypothetical protein
LRFADLFFTARSKLASGLLDWAEYCIIDASCIFQLLLKDVVVVILRPFHSLDFKINMAIIVSATNEGPVVNIAAWFGTIVMIFGVCSRTWIKYSILQKWTPDDALVIVAMVSLLLGTNSTLRYCANYSDEKLLGCAMTVTISMTVVNGLGKPQSSLSDHQIANFQKVNLPDLVFISESPT